VQYIERLEQTISFQKRGKAYNSLRVPKKLLSKLNKLLLKLLLDREHLYEHLKALVNSLVN